MSSRRFSGFTVISGLGWCLDFMVMGSLVQVGTGLFVANATGAFCGVTFVYVVAGRHIFDNVRTTSPWVLIGFYWLWQAVAIVLASGLIAGLGGLMLAYWGPDGAVSLGGYDLEARTLAGVGAKILVTPLTLIANFFFMRFLLESRKLR